MTWFDIAVLFVTGFSTLIAFMRGFSRELASIFTFLTASAGTLWAFGHFRDMARTMIEKGWLADLVVLIVPFLLLYAVSGFFFHRWAKFFSRREKRNSPFFFDRLLGGVFGFCRGVLTLALAFVVYDMMVSPEHSPEILDRSVTYPYIRDAADLVKPFVPDQESLKKRLDILKEPPS